MGSRHPSASTSSLLSSSSAGDPRSSAPSRNGSVSGHPSSLSEKYSLAPNPETWGTALLLTSAEPDDILHNPDPKRDRKNDKGGHIFTARGIANLGCLFILAAGLLTLFAGFPVISHFLGKPKQSTQGGFNLGGTNATGQVAVMPGNFGLIDVDTPQDAYTKASYMDPNDMWELVFSDEFNVDGRTFYPGDDPYWEAADLHYWQTNDLEWYDPSAATTKGAIDPEWNKFCFTGGMLVAAVTLPGSNNIRGLWPAVWSMGNLGRAGYGASLEGMWPYTYDSCDVGTLPNQTYPGTLTPLAAVTNGDPQNNDMLSYLPGQRLSACTCPGESHPGPVRANGDYVGRAAPEIDVFEATIDGGIGKVSQSGQWAPFNAQYAWLNTTDNLKIYNPGTTGLNTYVGGAFQQTTSALSLTNQQCYEHDSGCFSIYAFEYAPGFDNSYITWVTDDKPVWTLMGAGMGADPAVEIGARAVPQEPMYIIANLGLSPNFGSIDFDNLIFPTSMAIDYIRVYQPKGAKNVGCDPAAFPTKDYIDTYLEAYTNANLTGWGVPNFNQSIPKNRLQPGGC